MTIKNWMNRVSSLTLAAAFMAVAGGLSARDAAPENPPPAPQADTSGAKAGLPPGHTYWKMRIPHKDKDGNKVYTTYDGAVFEVWREPGQGIIAMLHSVDPHDAKMRKLAAKVLKKEIGDVTDADVLQFCGYRADLEDMKEQPPDPETGPLGKWSGTISVRIKGLPGQADPNGTKILFFSKLHFNIEEIGEMLAHAEGYKLIPLLGKEADFVRVMDPPPVCAAPATAPLTFAPRP